MYHLIIFCFMSTGKPRIVKDFNKLDDNIIEQIKLAYPDGFQNHLVSYTDRDGNRRSALPFESDTTYYLVRMTRMEAVEIIEEDEDYDNQGLLKEEIKEDYSEKHSEDLE